MQIHTKQKANGRGENLDDHSPLFFEIVFAIIFRCFDVCVGDDCEGSASGNELIIIYINKLN